MTARHARWFAGDARRAWHAYLFAVAATALTAALRMAVFETGDPPVVIAFIVPIVLSAILGGVGPGIAATAVAAVLLRYLLMEPQYSFRVDRPANLVSWWMLIAVGVFTSALLEALHRSRRRLQAAEELATVTLAGIADGVITAGVDGRVEFMNAQAERLTGWKVVEAHGRALTDVLRVVDAATRVPLAEPVARIRGARAAVDLAQGALLIAREGRELAVDASGAPIRGRDGGARGVVIVFRDCSERRDAEAAMRESEERLRLAQDTGGVGVFDFDVASGALTCSQSLERIYGIADAERIARYDDWRARVHGDDVERVERAWRSAVEANEPIELEYRIVRPSGEVRWIAARANAFRRADGTPYRVLGINVDVSEHKRSEDALRRAYDVLALAQRASHSGVWDHDLAAGVHYASPELCDLYGVPADAPMHRAAWLACIHAEDRERIRVANAQIVDAGTEWSAEFRIVHPLRGERWIASRGTLARDPEGRPLRFTGVDMDITERRRAQEALLDSETRFRSYIEHSPVACSSRPPTVASSTATRRRASSSATTRRRFAACGRSR